MRILCKNRLLVAIERTDAKAVSSKTRSHQHHARPRRGYHFLDGDECRGQRKEYHVTSRTSIYSDILSSDKFVNRLSFWLCNDPAHRSYAVIGSSLVRVFTLSTCIGNWPFSLSQTGMALKDLRLTCGSYCLFASNLVAYWVNV